MTEKLFAKEVSNLGLELNPTQLKMFNIYCTELLEYNKHTNLTAIKNKEDVYLKHFYDSLTLLKSVNLTEEKVIDVGTGPGFPGLALKIAFPNIDLTLLDSNNKKTKFLTYICEKLEINDVKIINDRIESFVINNRYAFDIVTARAVSHLRIISELCLPLLTPEGLFIALKGDADTEIIESKTTLKVLNSEIVNIEKFVLPIELSKRSIITLKRKGNIADCYPRAYDKILKKPLK